VRVVAVIDGEHHPRVARDALDRVASEHELCGVLFAGGEEKVGQDVLGDPAAHYGRDVMLAGNAPAEALRELAAEVDAQAVVDISGEPVLDGPARFRLASAALHFGLDYRAPGLELRPPPAERLDYDGPVLAVIGTGKRTGKTAVAGHYATLLRGLGAEPVLVAMGRGGPPEPQLVRAEERPDLRRLLEIARAGGHAASDYLEDAALTGVTCIGCRRCGEGPAGETFETNVPEGVRLALELEPDVLLLEGSGASLPPVEADRTVCVTSAARAQTEALSYLGPYRLMRADLVVIVGAGRLDPAGLREIEGSLGKWSPGAMIVGCELEPEPATAVRRDGRVALFTTASGEHEAALRERLSAGGVDVRVFSSALARRRELERDLDRALRERCDLFLTEIKAAAIEVVAEAAERHGVELVFLRNRPVSLPGEPDLDRELASLFEDARTAGRTQRAAAGDRGGRSAP
jgi:cyclic 2,3-diphosphoglycerate synthase